MCIYQRVFHRERVERRMMKEVKKGMKGERGSFSLHWKRMNKEVAAESPANVRHRESTS